MKTKGQFLLFTLEEFAHWLANTSFTRRVTRIQNHHTWLPDYPLFKGTNHFPLLEGMRRHHVEENGWADIGQHLTTFPDGTVAVCRSFEKVPACIFGANKSSLCIEHLGNFDLGHDAMTAAHRRTAVAVNALLCREFSLGVNTDAIVYHHWYRLDSGVRNDGIGNNKSCPGTAFFGGNKVADCRAHFLPLVLAALADHSPAPASTTTPASNSSGAPTPVPSAPLARFRVSPTADGFLAVRAAPKVGAPELDRLPSGTLVETYATSGKWRRIHPLGPRWVSSRYLEPITDAPSPVAVSVTHTAAPFRFDLPAPTADDIDDGMLLWATYYYGQPATALATGGIPLRNLQGKTVGPAISQRDWCLGAMEGTLIVQRADGQREAYNYEGKGSSRVTSCGTYFPGLSPKVLAATEKICWRPARGPFGDGAAKYLLSPYRSIAVDRRHIPLGSALYIPSARGISIKLPDGSTTLHDGYFFAADVGGLIKGSHIDVFLGNSTKNPFPFIKSNANGKFSAHRLTNPTTTAFLASLH